MLYYYKTRVYSLCTNQTKFIAMTKKNYLHCLVENDSGSDSTHDIEDKVSAEDLRKLRDPTSAEAQEVLKRLLHVH